jgi:hypothetical protein
MKYSVSVERVTFIDIKLYIRLDFVLGLSILNYLNELTQQQERGSDKWGLNA